ncbi:MAG: RNA polymerase sigma factor [Patescibacteria group bacterium]
MVKPIGEQEYREAYFKVYAFFVRRVDNQSDVEDLTSETLNEFLIFKKKEIDRDMPYLWGIARNKLKQHYTSNSRYKANYSDKDIENLMAEGTSNEYRDRIERLIECAKEELKHDDFGIIVACYMYDFNSTEISKETGIKNTTIRSRLSRGLNRIKGACLKIWCVDNC